LSKTMELSACYWKKYVEKDRCERFTSQLWRLDYTI